MEIQCEWLSHYMWSGKCSLKVVMLNVYIVNPVLSTKIKTKSYSLLANSVDKMKAWNWLIQKKE